MKNNLKYMKNNLKYPSETMTDLSVPFVMFK